jgi:hypothetical protein
MVALLEEESVAVWVPDTQGTQTDIMGRAREMNVLLQILKLIARSYNMRNKSTMVNILFLLRWLPLSILEPT